MRLPWYCQQISQDGRFRLPAALRGMRCGRFLKGDSDCLLHCGARAVADSEGRGGQKGVRVKQTSGSVTMTLKVSLSVCSIKG